MLELSLVPSKLVEGVRTCCVLRVLNRSSECVYMVRLAFRLPNKLHLLRGDLALMLDRLHAGERAEVALEIKALAAGTFPLEQINLSFRDAKGRPHRFDGPAPGWEVRPFVPSPAPIRPVTRPAELDLMLPSPTLTLGKWALLAGELHNHGPGLARQITITTNDRRWEIQSPKVFELPVGASLSFAVNIKPLEAGEVMLNLKIISELSDGSRRTDAWTQTMRVVGPTDAQEEQVHIGQVWQITGDVGLIKQTGYSTDFPRCPSCGAPLAGDATQLFCSQCGARLR